MTSANHSHPYGLSPVARDPSLLSPALGSAPPTLTSKELQALVPKSEACRKAAEYVKDKLGDLLWNHSLRAFTFGAVIATTQFPSWSFSAEALYIACLFHDLAATEKELKATKTSFEFHSAVLAREYLLSPKEGQQPADNDLVDSVCEAIWRHTDFISSQISVTGQLIQLGTLYDNLYANSSWIHPSTAAAVVELYPRQGWANCFHSTMKREVELKPWSHTTAFDYMEEKGTGAWEMLLRDDLGKALEGKTRGGNGEKL
ncbi:hypothetical protein JCM6882_002202 [Rhodosporidiobolus microsporus]